MTSSRGKANRCMFEGIRTMSIIANVRVGRPKTEVTASSHVPGVREGNNPGQVPKPEWPAERSTGINPAQQDPIDPRSPKLTPP